MKKQKKMDYGELVAIVKENELKSYLGVIYYLVGYKGFVDHTDLENIGQLFADGLVEVG